MKEELMDALWGEVDELKHFSKLVGLAVACGSGDDFINIALVVDEQLQHITERLWRIYSKMNDEMRPGK